VKIFLFLLLLPVSLMAEAKFIGRSDLSRFENEQLEFSLFFRNVPAAKARMRCENAGDHAWRITVQTATKFWADLLFSVRNRYETVIDQQSGRVLQTDKKIKQKNLTQEMLVQYDYPALLATTSSGTQWAIAESLQTLFSLLYQLRSMDLKLADSLHCILDIESQLWRVAGTVIAGENSPSDSGAQAIREVVLDFVPMDRIEPRKWKTDLLTNRFGRQGRFILRLGPPPENEPMWMQIGGGTNPVSLKLLSRKKG